MTQLKKEWEIVNIIGKNAIVTTLNSLIELQYIDSPNWGSLHEFNEIPKRIHRNLNADIQKQLKSIQKCIKKFVF
jgi:hypothetical protein